MIGPCGPREQWGKQPSGETVPSARLQLVNTSPGNSPTRFGLKCARALNYRCRNWKYFRKSWMLGKSEEQRKNMRFHKPITYGGSTINFLMGSVPLWFMDGAHRAPQRGGAERWAPADATTGNLFYSQVRYLAPLLPSGSADVWRLRISDAWAGIYPDSSTAHTIDKDSQGKLTQTYATGNTWNTGHNDCCPSGRSSTK